MAAPGAPPESGEAKRILMEFEAAITCRHGHTIAPLCWRCSRPNWLDCPVRTEPGEPPETVGDVVRRFLEEGKIASVEVARRHVEGKRRARRYRRFAAIAGLSVATGILLYQGGKLVLHLWTEGKSGKSNSG